MSSRPQSLSDAPADGADAAARPPAKRRGWRTFFSVFKWCRIAVLLVLLCVVVLGLFLNRVGLPEWIKQRIVAQMRARGWEIEFSRLRLRWYRGIVAESLQLHRTNSLAGPQLFVETAEFRLNHEALFDLDLHADSVMVRGGRLIWAVPGTNQPHQTFTLNHVSGELFFLPEDRWELRSLEASLLGTHVRVRGTLTNASLVRDWTLTKRPPRRPGEEPEEFWRQFLLQAGRIQLHGQPELTVAFSLDARDLRGVEANAKLLVPGIDSPWAGGTNLAISARLLPRPDPDDAWRAEVKIKAQQAHSRWLVGTNVLLAAQVEPSFTQWLPTNTTATLELADAQTSWGKAANAQVSVRCEPTPTNAAFRATEIQVTLHRGSSEWGTAETGRVALVAWHSGTNFLPATIRSDVEVSGARTRWATSEWARVSNEIQLPAAADELFETNRPWWERFQDVPIEGRTTVSNLLVAGMKIPWGVLSNGWQSPTLDSTLSTQWEEGAANIHATLNVETRELDFAMTTPHLDPRWMVSRLGTNVPQWLGDLEWRSMTALETKGRLRLPVSTNREPSWQEILPTVEAAGHFQTGPVACRRVELTKAGGHFAVTNLQWRMPDLRLDRPEGSLNVDFSGDQGTGQFHAKVDSGWQLAALRPAFSPEEAGPVFDLFEFTAPPLLRGEVWGNWNQLAQVGAACDVALTNVVFRKQPVKFCSARLEYTNQFLSILRPVILREGESGVAPGIGIDLGKQRLYLTNATGNLSPMAITRAIGPHIAEKIEPYRFEVPPMARVEGEIPIGQSDGTERMSFDLDGGRFEWRSFHLERLKGLVLWRGNELTLTNLQGRWHGGDIQGHVHFDFHQPRGGLFSFYTKVDDADLKAVINDMQPGKTNHIEGVFGGELAVTHAYCNDLKSWFGRGRAYMRDGLLWDIPIFGAFSGVLNAISPGLGHSRAKEGSATFRLTNSIIYSKDLQIQATGTRLQYQGTVDFETHVDARMEAELLRNMPGIGLVFSKILWPVTKLFEYRVTGTLENPKTEPIWGIPRLIFFPFQPVKTIKEIFGAGEKKAEP